MSRVLLVAAVICTMSPSAMTATNVVLTTTAELRALSEAEAKTGRRFDLNAQILQKNTGITGCAFIVRDDSGGVLLYAEDNPASFTYSPGDVVRRRGATDVNIDHEHSHA